MKILIAAIIGGILFSLAGYGVYRVICDKIGLSTTLTERVVVQRIEDVSKLVSSEFYARDVIDYRHTFLLSEKVILVIVDVHGFVGVDLKKSKVKIDHASRHLFVEIPHSTLIAPVVDKITFIDSRGLWNKPTTVDRDLILQQLAERLPQIGKEMKVTEQADRSAKLFLERMFANDGYTTEVSFDSTFASTLPIKEPD